MEPAFKEVVENVKRKSIKLRREGRRCCANQVLHVATYLENTLTHKEGFFLKEDEEKEK